MDCGDWRVGTNDECGFDFHPKQTDKSGFETNIGLGFRVNDGNVLEMKANGDDAYVMKNEGLTRVKDADGTLRKVALETQLNLEANQTTVDTAFNLKANQTDVDAALDLEASQTTVDTALNLKADQNAVDTALGLH